MSKTDDIIILENPQKGMASHPLLGIGLLRQIDVSTYPGLARLNPESRKVSSTTVVALPQWIVQNPKNTDELFALDSAGQVYTSTNAGISWSTVGGETSGGLGQGMAIWKNYLFVARATTLDVYGPLGGSPSWSNSWKTDLDATNDFHTMLASLDDNLYICCGRYIYKISELTTFLPGTSSTYSTTAHAITLPANYNAKCLADFGSNLMIGTWLGSSPSFYTMPKSADIFPYNRSTLTLGLPIRLNENGVHAMITVNNRLYVMAGLHGGLYVTDGVSIAQVSEIPNYAVNTADSGQFIQVYPGAIIQFKGKVVFGLSNTAGGIGNMGVWSFDPSFKRLLLENIISTGQDGTSYALSIGALCAIDRDFYLIGWLDGTIGSGTYGIDKKLLNAFVTSYGGVIETQLVQVGQSLGNRTIQQVEFYLSKPLVASQGIKVKYRKDLTSSFTTLGTVDFSTNGGIQSFNLSAATITNAVFVQFRIELTGGGGDSPELVRVLLKPSL